ncbi:transcriptional regulator [Methylobacterium sp. C25]|uniref:helix-turn-helix domain-containing protein n=1 Tax=Methylobacterium sp. C25 TaxID=2721622 RepID=UPI001F401055|nr:helix-turn-helix transcriptional regulator [Methylobacterium sp. C25]MCE4224052.1 transcriptional regulator [Methylobacterium sp. C25]
MELTREEVIARLRRQIADRGSQQDWARAAGVSPTYLGDVLKGRRVPGDRILLALGVQRVERFVSLEAQS